MVGLITTGCLNWIIMPLYVRKGVGVRVPNLVGLSLDEAQKRLRERGLTLKMDTTLPSREVPKGRIMSQDPPPGRTVKPTRSVLVVVSEGKKRVRIPRVEGLLGEEAEAKLRGLGLWVEVRELPSDMYQPGVAMGTSPPSGQEAWYGDTVVLVVSSGRPVVVPPEVLIQIGEYGDTLEGGSVGP